MVHIDGSQGEGGGQVLRTSLALSILTGKPVRIDNIRAGRKKAGLMAQHLKAVEAAAAISGAKVQGAVFSGKTLVFEPQGIFPGRYRFDIGTAGSTSLVLQTILVPLSFAETSSSVIVTGGTHVPWSPTFHYLKSHFLQFLRKAGFDLDLELEGAGYYPRGGGRVRAIVWPARDLSPLNLVSRGRLKGINGLSAATNLPGHIIERQASQARKRLKEEGLPVSIEQRAVQGNGQGTFLHLLACFENSQCCFDALGARGKPAERVADEAVEDLLAFLGTDAAIDEHLADQLILPLSMVKGVSVLKTSRITLHLQTNVEIIQTFLPVRITVDGALGSPGVVEVRGEKSPLANI
jgi:RNA 3'-terminal phosphate cyclase (ATP)